jgi:flavin-dependent dehydrogenase
MRLESDLLVIGGGPAGSLLAALAARAGARVDLVERDRFPRDTLCGEFIAAEGRDVLRRAGLLPRLVAAGARSIRRLRLTGGGGSRLEQPLPDLPGVGRSALGVSRALLDATLFELAASSGAHVHAPCTALSPLIDDGRVGGFRLRRERSARADHVLRARLVVAADGRRSVLARVLHPRLGDPPRSGPRSRFGLKTHLEIDPDRVGDRVELHLFDGGYAGLAAVEGERVNLCMLTTVRALRDCGGSPDRLLAERVLANPSARATIGDRPRHGAWKSVGPLRFGARRAAAAGALFVGDAAGTVDPFCGEGVSNALSGAELALPFVLEALAHGGLDARLAREYRRAWRRAFVPVTRRVRGLGRLLERPRLAGALLPLLHGSAGKRLVAATRTAGPARRHA